MKDYWKYEKSLTRGKLFKLMLLASVPFVGWVGLLLVAIIKPHKIDGKWKLEGDF